MMVTTTIKAIQSILPLATGVMSPADQAILACPKSFQTTLREEVLPPW